ncbi:Sec-independent protein translocase protein TatB [Roseomonas sp. OT10]|uniref:Sec-independent protein translocase protein TatB n=1 Tax=Roseomonas cutis TaxID=2897332 RepID=UPI001E5600ED|nr:Sec-independent protein translocase protein TatB [Roseomonas sp. OT10]UFN50731.1 Sec-independent protein translocase protein TatB [Roseomonas sp. OT10]
MFDLAWSEIAVIAVVAIVVIGPKDLPDTIRTVAKGIGKLRRMAGELQGHLDEVVREAKLEDVRDQIRDIRNFDLKGEIERAVDKDGSVRAAFNDDPFRAPPPTPSADAAPATPANAVGEAPEGAGTDATAAAPGPDPALTADAPVPANPPETAAAHEPAAVATGFSPLPEPAAPPVDTAPPVPPAAPVADRSVADRPAAELPVTAADAAPPGPPKPNTQNA